MFSSADNSTDGSKESTPTNKRRKITSLACENCRSSHLKCDGLETCGSCTRKGLICVYPESKRRGRKPSSSKILKNDSNKKCKIEDFQFSTKFNNKFKNQDNANSNENLTYINTNLQSNPHPSLNTDSHEKFNYINQYDHSDILKRTYSSLFPSYGVLSQQDILKFIYITTNVYSKYCLFLFPFIHISDPLVAIQYLSTPINILSREDKIHYGGINAVLAIGKYYKFTIFFISLKNHFYRIIFDSFRVTM